MGVPGYFAAARRICPTAILSPGTAVEIDDLYIDFNCVVHGCAGRVTTAGEAEADEAVLDATVLAFRAVVADASPRCRVAACADGVPPQAKMSQQRNRRFLACKRGEAGPGAAFDRNKITPGTEFARRLDERMAAEAERMRADTGKEVTYSGTDEPGEGEQKIVRDIRSRGKSPGRASCVYGLDADLVILCCCLAAQGYPVPWLCREESAEASGLSFVDAGRLVRAMAGGGSGRALWNHVVCSFFVGNDFLPPLSCLNMARDSQWLMRLRRVCDSGGLTLASDGGLDWKHIESLVRHLSDTEDRDFADADAEYWSRPVPARPSWDDYPASNRDERLKHIRPGADGWRARYYAGLFGLRSATGITRVVGEYTRGLSWVFDYYRGEFDPPAPAWYYRYYYSPTSLDVFNYVASFPEAPPSADLSGLPRDIVSPEELLRFVTPEASKHLLGAGCAPRRPPHLFPRDSDISTYLKRKIWECSALLPPAAATDVL